MLVLCALLLESKKNIVNQQAAVLYKHHLFTISFVALLEETHRFTQIRACRSMGEIEQLIREKKISHLFIDYHFLQADILSFVQQTAAINKDVYVLVVSSVENEQLISRIQDAGAHAFISKKSGKKEIEQCLASVNSGNYYISPEVLNTALRQHLNWHGELFTAKEMEVLRHVAAGDSNREISVKLKRSVYTVVTHRRNMMKKVDAANVAVLIKKAIEMGML